MSTQGAWNVCFGIYMRHICSGNWHHAYAMEKRDETREIINSFTVVLLYTRVGGVPRVADRPDGPCDPRAPVQSPWGAGLGVPPEVPRSPLGRFDDPPERWPRVSENRGFETL